MVAFPQLIVHQNAVTNFVTAFFCVINPVRTT